MSEVEVMEIEEPPQPTAGIRELRRGRYAIISLGSGLEIQPFGLDKADSEEIGELRDDIPDRWTLIRNGQILDTFPISPWLQMPDSWLGLKFHSHARGIEEYNENLRDGGIEAVLDDIEDDEDDRDPWRAVE